MHQFQAANDYQQNLIDQQLRKNDENGYNLWYQNYSNPNNQNNIMNFNNQQSFNNTNANYSDPSMLNQPSSSQQLGHSNLIINNNFQNSVQQVNDEGPINCERCQKAPIEYIRLNCGHNFCLECMAISFLKGEGRLIPASENQTSNISNSNENGEESNNGQNDSIEMTCFKCGQLCELGHQSRSAIFIFIQMIIQKYEQKSSPINSTQTSSSAAFGMQINNQVNSNLTNTSSSIQASAQNNQIINGSSLPNQMNISDKITSIDNNLVNIVGNQINGVLNVNMQNNQAINQINVNGSQINAIGQQQKQQQIIQGDQMQYFDQNQIQFDNSKIIQPLIQKEDSGKNDEKLIALSNNISNSNRVSNYTSNQNAIRGSDEDLLQYESIESNNILPTQKQQLNIQADVSLQYQQMQQQQQQFQQRNRINSPNTNETQNKNFNAVQVNNNPNAQPIQNFDSNQMIVQQQASNIQYENANPNFETPFIKQQLLISTSKNQNQIQSQDKIRISQHEQKEDDKVNLLQQQLLQKQLLQKGSQNGSVDQQILLQQQQENMKNSQYQSSQNNLVSTPNYSILTEKKPTQPQYSQMMPINNQTPQHTQNQAKKSPHLSKSTHILSNNVNLTPMQQQMGKNNYNLNSAQSQQFQNDYGNNYNQQLQLQMEHEGTHLLNGDNKHIHPKLSAFSASNNKSQAKQQYSNFSHLQPYGNGEEANSIFQAQLAHNQKHLPYRQQSQLETGIIEEYEANQLEINENLQNQKAVNLNQNLQQNQQDVQHQILGGNLQHQQINKLQLHQVDEIRESNSAFNSLIGGSTSSTQLNCNEHPFNELTLYCFTCDNKLLCIKCLQNGEHRDHDVQSISKNFEYLLGKMTETSHEINSSIEQLIIQQKRLVDKRKECLRQIKIIKDQIQDNLNDVKASIASREQHLLQQAEQIFMNKQSEILKEIQVIQNKTQVIQEVKNQFELICESYFKNKTTTNTDREVDSLPHQQHNQEQLLQEQQQKAHEQQTNHIQQQLEQILQQKFYLQQLQNEQHIQQQHQQNQQKNNQQIPQHYDILATENNSTEELHDTFKFSSEAEKISLYRFYQQCRSFLCQQGITRSSQGNEKINMTQLQQQQSPQYSSYQLTPHQPRTTQFNETPRSKHNIQQQLQFQNISQIHQSGVTSNYQSNQPSSYIQQHQMQQQSNAQRNQGNFESQYASIRSNISQPIEEEEYQQQQFQQNYQQYNIMSSQDLSQLIDDVQRIKKEATQIDLNNYASRQNTTLNNSNLNQKENSILPSSSIQAPQRGNQLFHDYLNKQRYQNQLQQQYQNTQLQHSEEKNNQGQPYQKEQPQEYMSQLNYQQSQKINQSKDQKLQNHNEEENNNYNQVKQPTSRNSQYLMQRLQENMENYQGSLNGTSNKKINSSTLNQNSYLAFPTQSSETELYKKDQAKNSSYLKQKRSKWLDEEALEQDQEHQNNYYTYSNQNQYFYDRINAIENFEQGNQKQKQEFNKHLDNIFRKNGIHNKNSLLNKLQYQNSLEHQPGNQIMSNSVLVGSNGYQTERLNTNPELLYSNINRSYTNTAIKQKQDFTLAKQDDKYKTEPFSPNFKRQMINQAQYSYTTRASNQNTSLSRQTISNSHLKVNASLSTHNNSNTANLQKTTLQKDQQINAQNSNYQLNQRSLKKQQNQSATQRDRNLDSLFETLRIQKEQYNIKKKQYFLQE
ncbi:B-box zinc finger protein (macronuclear) [Tetrahymena thermophila SB210]|uniref:B-box zinc finger protein n=1 Tax=Tetrahymena thermophila (strain SB210) TaxID=312017 RepID=I7M7H7_TETTS|nr:B-box zinc finger protein [Tetrahymena thermophila SB210]EAR93749.1 B-box zinc finger protein [Tetrahymena thermophila SB210]|eukprot:XP_001013994.1 B-box zinc finger protein [Tetrahymena thermophila SB210]